MGRKRINKVGHNRQAMASVTRRMGTDQLASNRWCTMTRNQPPMARLKKNIKATSQEKPTCFKGVALMADPPIAPIAPTTISMEGTLRHLDKSSGANCWVCGSELIRSFFKLGAFRVGHVLDRSQLASLQRPHVIN